MRPIALRPIAVAFALIATPLHALAQTPSVDVAAKLRDQRLQCESEFASRLPATGTKVRDAVIVMRQLLTSGVGKCGPADVSAAEPAVLISGIASEIDGRRADHACSGPVQRPECAITAVAGARLIDLQTLANGDYAVLIKSADGPRFDRSMSYSWRFNLNSFGSDPRLGVSLLRYVLQAGPASAQALGDAAPGRPFGEIQPKLDTPGYVDQDCSDACKTSVARVVSAFPLFAAMDTVAQKTTAGVGYTQAINSTAAVAARWDAYHFGGGQGRAQLPWELALNNAIYTRNPTPLEPGTPWRTPPNGAFILVHPSAGLALKDIKGADSQFVGVVELFGYSRWGYDAKTNARANEIGASLITAYQPRDDGDDWGYGVLVRLPISTLNIAWVRTELDNGKSDDTFAFTLDLSRFFPQGDAKCLFKLPSCKGGQ